MSENKVTIVGDTRGVREYSNYTESGTLKVYGNTITTIRDIV